MGKVLTVDDSEPMRKLVGMVLGSAGHQVTTACNGAEALLRSGRLIFLPANARQAIHELLDFLWNAV